MIVNYNPKLTKYLVKNDFFVSNHFKVVDVGARHGFKGRWARYNKQIDLIGFEPDEEEYKILNKNKSSNEKFYQFAVDSKKGKQMFYLSAYRASSSFYPLNDDFVYRFPSHKQLAIEKEVEVETIDLDSIKINMDFMKIDTEGAELDVLKGAKKHLNDSVVGVELEVSFNGFRKNNPLFNEIDSYLKEQGFDLFCLSPKSHPKNALPHFKTGQCIGADSLYLKYGVKYGLSGWDSFKVMKLASIMETYGLNDCAIELITYAQNKGILNKNNNYIDLLVPHKFDGILQALKELALDLKSHL